MDMWDNRSMAVQSLPSRERGLKFSLLSLVVKPSIVAPFAGAWIEIVGELKNTNNVSSRALRGSVD